MAPDARTLLHLAVDFNTPQRPRTTPAIAWLVDELADYANVVVAYRRVAHPVVGDETEVPARTGRVFDFPYFGLPLGVGLKRAMRRAARRTIALLDARGIRPDLVHAHKLSFEGIAGWYVARHYRVPLLLSVRGEAETKVFHFKPLMRGLLRRICARASRIYLVSAWFGPELRARVPGTAAKERLLPNIVRNIGPTITPHPPGAAFVAIFNLDTWRRKGLVWLLDGFARAAARRPSLRLEIVGEGGEAARAKARALIAARGLSDRVTLRGGIANADLLAALPHYRGLLLPSLNETFGMVYVEALFAGLPVLFTAGTAIDGYLDGLDVARTVPPRDARAIAAAILDMDANADRLRANIAAAAPELFARFDPAASVARYRADLAALLGPAPAPAPPPHAPPICGHSA